MNDAVPTLPPDYHTHNELCKHARGTPADYVDAARRNGVAEIACTDHCPTDDGFGVAHRMALEQFSGYCEQVAEAKARSPDVRVLLGIEADYYRGCEKFLAAHVERHDFDVVLGSVHFLDYWSEPRYGQGLSNPDDPVQLWRDYFERIGELAGTGLYDVVAHPDLPKRFGNEINRETFRDLALPALDRIAAAGLCIEINTSGAQHPHREFYPAFDFLQWAAERGIGLTFGSDAHDPERVGDGFADAVRLARAAGFTHARRFERRRRTAVAL